MRGDTTVDGNWFLLRNYWGMLNYDKLWVGYELIVLGVFWHGDVYFVTRINM